jgi:hypothetical protein
MTLDRFVGIGASHQHKVFDYVYDLLRSKSPEVVTIEQHLNQYTSIHSMLFRRDFDYIRKQGQEDGSGEFIAGVLYALENGTPMFFVDGSYNKGAFWADIDLATSIDLSKATVEETHPEHLIIYNGEIKIPDTGYERDETGRPVALVWPSEEDYSNSVPERNTFSSDAINRIAKSLKPSSLAHIGGRHHFDGNAFRAESKVSPEYFAKFKPLQDLVETDSIEYHDSMLRKQLI